MVHSFPGRNPGEVDKSRPSFVTYTKSQRYLSIKLLLSLSHFSTAAEGGGKHFLPLTGLS